LDSEGLFLRGKEAADRGNYDYAITIFRELLRADPRHRNGRIALRGCEMQRFTERGGGSNVKAQAVFKGAGPLMMMHLGGKPEKVIELCETFLVNDPTNVTVLMKLAGALEKLGYMEAAVDTLEFARQRAPEHLPVLRRLGDMLAVLGQFDKAVRCFEEVRRIKPEDREAFDKVRQISAQSHLHKSKIDQAQSYRGVLRDEKNAEALEKGQSMARTDGEKDSEIVKAKEAAEAKPDDDQGFMRLGDLYLKYDRYTEAEAAFRKAFEVGKKYPAREKMGTTRLRYLETLERKAEEESEKNNRDPQSVFKAREAKKRRVEFAAKEFEFRRKQYPTDMKLAYQLGMYYVDAGGEENAQKAIQQFQQAMSNPGLRTRAQYMLGRCFAMSPKTLDMAKEQFSKALELCEDPSGENAKALMYELGQVAERVGDAPEAIKWYKRIFSIDAAFRDVSKKVQELG
jgi:tetratricopeptide (TPR) repeat protein